MKETQTNQFICHRYSHAGTFKADRFDTRIFDNILCYQNQICFELDQQQCIGHLNEVNCTISALSRCKCGPETLQSCPVKSIYAPQNFVEVREFEDIVMIATKVKVSE
uniref:Uncharacterized protein n=1 Tax=Panagrolaimus davidi TaxID=227884 RepID=A0A914QX15_9BILA